MQPARRPTLDPPATLPEVRLRCADPTEAHDRGARVYHEHRLTIRGDATKFQMRIDAASLGPITIGWLGYDTEVSLDTPGFEKAYQVNILTRGWMHAYCGHERLTATPRTGMVNRPDRPSGFTGWRTPEPMLAIKIDRPSLERELERMIDRPVSKPIAFAMALDLSQRRAADWARLVFALAAGLRDPDALVRQPMIAAPLVQSLLAGLLLAAGHDHRPALDGPTPHVGPTTIRRARTYIEQHVDQPLTTTEVAANVGVSTRSLQQSFRQSLGITPNQLIRHTRLTRAHADLLAAEPANTNVSDIAARWGFRNAGRFATYYRARYWTHPSDTLHGRTPGYAVEPNASNPPHPPRPT